MTLRLMAIDPGSPMGGAWLDERGLVTFQTLRPSVDGREASIMRMVASTIRMGLIHAVAYEAPFFSPKTAWACRQLMNDEGAIRAACQDCRVPYYSFTPPEVKNAVGLPGNSRKERVMQRVNELGYPVKDSHQADAVACLLLLKTVLSQVSENVPTKQRKLKP